MSYDLQPRVIGGGNAKPSNTCGERKDGRTLPRPLTSRNQARIQMVHVQSHCTARPATRRNSGPMWTLELHSGTRTFALLARKQYPRRCLTCQSYMTLPRPYCPLLRGRTIRGSRPNNATLLTFSSSSPVDLFAPHRRVQKASGTIS